MVLNVFFFFDKVTLFISDTMLWFCFLPLWTELLKVSYFTLRKIEILLLKSLITWGSIVSRYGSDHTDVYKTGVLWILSRITFMASVSNTHPCDISPLLSPSISPNRLSRGTPQNFLQHTRRLNLVSAIEPHPWPCDYFWSWHHKYSG